MKEDAIKNVKLSLHLKYSIAIFILLTCTIGGLSLYNQDLAIKGLSTAGLLTSIVLAVIAILITLWDVAGQKNNILDVKSSIEELKNVSAEINELVAGIEVRNSETMKVLTDYITHYQEKNELNINKINDLTEKFEKIKISDDSRDDYQSIKKELESMNQILKNDLISVEKSEINLQSNSKKVQNYNTHYATENLGLIMKNKNEEQLEILRKALKNLNTIKIRGEYNEDNEIEKK